MRIVVDGPRGNPGSKATSGGAGPLGEARISRYGQPCLTLAGAVFQLLGMKVMM